MGGLKPCVCVCVALSLLSVLDVEAKTTFFRYDRRTTSKDENLILFMRHSAVLKRKDNSYDGCV